MSNQTVIGVFDTKTQANTAKQSLIDASFDADNIDVSYNGEHGTTGSHYRRGDDDSALENFFERLFGMEDDYDEEYRTRTREVASRGTLVTVHTDTMAEANRAAAVLDRYGAIDFDDRYQQYKGKTFDADRNRTELNERFGDVDNTIKVMKEDVAIGKREVVNEAGGVTVRSRIVEKPVEETLRLRREEVYVNREAVDRPVTAADADFQEQTITLQEKAEEAVVSKSARVVEEISVGKKVVTDEKTIRETARETEVDIERGVVDNDTRLRNDTDMRK